MSCRSRIDSKLGVTKLILAGSRALNAFRLVKPNRRPLPMNTSRRLAMLSLLAIFPATAESKQDFRLDYPLPFTRDQQKSSAWLARLHPDQQRFITDYDVYEGRPLPGVSELRVIRMRFKPEFKFQLESSASAIIAGLSKLDGVTSPHGTVSALMIDGHPARLTSFFANRRGGKVGAQMLFVYDTKLNRVFQVQIMTAKQSSLLAGAGQDDIAAELENAKRIALSLKLDQ